MRYHGASSLVSQLYHEGLIKRAVPQLATFEAGVTLPALKASSLRRSLATPSGPRWTKRWPARKAASPRFCSSTCPGMATSDMASYDKYFAGALEDYDYPEDAIRAALARLPRVGA